MLRIVNKHSGAIAEDRFKTLFLVAMQRIVTSISSTSAGESVSLGILIKVYPESTISLVMN